MAEALLEQLIYIAPNVHGYFFDAVIETNHQSDLKITTHPVQTGADVADHAYMEAQSVTMRVKMSDVMEDIIPGQFPGALAPGISRSASAFQILQDLQASRVPLRVQTLLRAYENMLIKALSAKESADSMNGLDCTVTLQEVIVAQTQTVKVSKRVQTTGKTDGGTTAGVSLEDLIDGSGSVIYKFAVAAKKIVGEITGGGE
jgi:hypothetical protein